MSIEFEGQAYEDKGAMPAEVRARYEAALAVGLDRIVATDDSGRPLPHDVGAALKQAGGLAGLMRAGKRAMEAQQAAEQAVEERTTGTFDPEKRRRSQRATLVFVGAILLAIMLFVGEWSRLSFTFDGGQLYAWGAAIGALACVFVLWPLLPTVRMPGGSKVLLTLFLLVMLTGAGTALANMANRLLAGPPQSWSFTVTDKRRITGKSASGWEIRARTEGRQVRLWLSRAQGQPLEVGRVYQGDVRQGALGYPVLSEEGLH